MVLSAYVDGEIPARFVPEVASAIERDPDVRAHYLELLELHKKLNAGLPVDVEASARRSWEAVKATAERTPRTLNPDVWHRRINVPMPALAAAATIVIALLGVVIWSLAMDPAEQPDSLAHRNDVDVTIRVEGSEMEQVLQWLVDKNMLGEINIQLPEQQFQIVGEPVFVKSAGFSGEVTQ